MKRLLLKGYANIRHYFPEGREECEVEARDEATLDDLCRLTGLPVSEVMLFMVNGRIAAADFIPGDGDTVEIFPVLCGG